MSATRSEGHAGAEGEGGAGVETRAEAPTDSGVGDQVRVIWALLQAEELTCERGQGGAAERKVRQARDARCRQRGGQEGRRVRGNGAEITRGERQTQGRKCKNMSSDRRGRAFTSRWRTKERRMGGEERNASVRRQQEM